MKFFIIREKSQCDNINITSKDDAFGILMKADSQTKFLSHLVETLNIRSTDLLIYIGFQLSFSANMNVSFRMGGTVLTSL